VFRERHSLLEFSSKSIFYLLFVISLLFLVLCLRNYILIQRRFINNIVAGQTERITDRSLHIPDLDAHPKDQRRRRVPFLPTTTGNNTEPVYELRCRSSNVTDAMSLHGNSLWR
jgi:hypothetical protein